MPMCPLTRKLQRAGLAAGMLLALSSAGHAYGGETIIQQLPQGWTPLASAATADASLTLSGQFQHQGNAGAAVLVQNGDAYGVAVVPGAPADGTASIVKTFKDIKTNAPRLSLIHPGSYQPACHGGESCAPLSIANESIGLCFGEASCEIIYFADGAYHELVVTD